MPVTPTYPGVYIEEIPSGVRTITGVATSVTAFVGYTALGPVNKPIRLFNFGDFERNFGGLHRDSEVSYAVQQFFLNGGGDAYVVRVASGAAAASLQLDDAAGNTVLTVQAANPGTWGNMLRLELDYATSNPDSSFNLTVKRYEKRGAVTVLAEIEKHQNLSMNSQSAAYAEAVVNNSSKLIKLTVTPSLTAEQGFSLSSDLSTFPTLTASQTTLTGIVDGSDAFSLELSSPLPTSIAQLRDAINAALATAGLDTRLNAVRADALGADTTDNFLKLASLDATEKASVQVTPAPQNDLSAAIGMGLANGGREFGAMRNRRPTVTGTASGDLADVASFNGALDVTVVNQATGQDILATTTITVASATDVGPALRDELQTLLRAIGNSATDQATVAYTGTRLHVLPSSDNPDVALSFSGAGANTLKLDGGAGVSDNLLQYSLGTGVAFGAQSNLVLGSDGSPPGATDILGSFDAKTGIYALRDVDLFNLLAIPRTSQLSENEADSVIDAAVSFCEQERAFYLIDPYPSKDRTTIADWASGASTSKNAAIFFPQIEVADPLNNFRARPMPPSGAVAGVMARTDGQRGVWKAPAGTDATITGVQGLSTVLTDQENGTLNPLGVNCLRTFPVYNTVVWGARTRRGADALADEYKYIPVRRLALFIEESLFRGTQWVVFEPNDEPLWAQIRLNVGAFMHNLFRQGAFQGQTPKESYLVKCDKETTTQNDINLGIVNIVVGFAPLKPAEFVIIKLQQLAGEVQT